AWGSKTHGEQGRRLLVEGRREGGPRRPVKRYTTPRRAARRVALGSRPALASTGTGEPRGPPVTSNQLRSASARRGPPAVDRDLRAVDPARLVGGEEEGEVGDLLRL